MSFFHCFCYSYSIAIVLWQARGWLGNFTEKYFNRIKEIGQLLFMLIVTGYSLEGKNARQNSYLQVALPTLQAFLFLNRKVFLSRRYVVIDTGTCFRVFMSFGYGYMSPQTIET